MLRCSNITSFDLSWDLPSHFESLHFPFISELIEIELHLVQIETNVRKNWMVTTCLETKYFSQHKPKKAVTMNDVIEIVYAVFLYILLENIITFLSNCSHILSLDLGLYWYQYYNCGRHEVQLCYEANIFVQLWKVLLFGE